ncbi:MAG TPA: right-handed parallel beta-helix repeat-containing protein [Candidatus Krumholzibacteria bacterium]
MSPLQGRLSASSIFLFWLPLLGTWQMMAVEGPFLAAIIARLADPKANLAAYGVAFAVAIIVESPVIMLMGAATHLAEDRLRLALLQRFRTVLTALVSASMLIVVLPPVWDWLAGDLLSLHEGVRRDAWYALLFLLPWPAAIADRRFHQGLMIRCGQTSRVAYGTLVRLGCMVLTALLLAALSPLPGAAVGGAALSSGVVGEAMATRWMARDAARRIARTPPRGGLRAMGMIDMSRYYAPLALTMVLSMAMQPTITFFLGQSRQALESLAVQPVIHGLTFLFRAWGLSYQEVGIARLGERGEQLSALARFGFGIAIAASLAMAILVWTPLAPIWFASVSGLSPEMTRFAVWPARLAVLLPFLSALLSMQRALLMHGSHTSVLGPATLVELGVLGITLFVGIRLMDGVGAIVAVVALLLARMAGNLWLLPPCRRIWKRYAAQAAVFLFMFAAFSVGGAHAKSWHVDPAASGGDGTVEFPFGRIDHAMDAAAAGDSLLLAAGVFDAWIEIDDAGVARRALMLLKDGVHVLGAGAGESILRGKSEDVIDYGIRAFGIGDQGSVSGLRLDGAIRQGINLVGASPRLTQLEVLNDLAGGSGVAMDVREGSFPEVADCVFDGGHSALFVEFESGGNFTRCVIGSRPHESLVVIDSNPRLVDCVIRSGGRDSIVLSSGSEPVLQACRIRRGSRWTVRVFGYAAGSVIDLGGNHWYSEDRGALQEDILDARDDAALGARVQLGTLLTPLAAPVGSLSRFKSGF